MGHGRERIAALVRADVVGSTTYLETHGLTASIDTRRQVLDLLQSAGGEVVDTLGDGALLAMESAAEAIRAAWALQQGLVDSDIALRVAVSAAQLDHRNHWSAHHEARSQQLEARCEPGQVVVDGIIRRSVRGIGGFEFAELESAELASEAHRVVSVAPRDLDGQRASTTELRAVLISDLCKDLASAPASDFVSRRISEGCIRARGGTVVDTNGGGSLAFFETCDAAIAASVDLRVNALDAGLTFAVGVAMGEVVAAGIDQFGLAVVEASRLLDLASGEPDPMVYTTGDVVDLAQIGSDARPLGEQRLRGITDPVAVFGVDQSHGATDALLELPAALVPEANTPLAGRAESLATLRQLWDSATNGVVCTAVVAGEEGVGKTRLVQELAVSAHQGGAFVLHGACDADLRVPYAPIATALSRCAPVDPDIAEALASASGPLRSLWSSGRSTSPKAEKTFAEAPNQYELFQAVAEAVRRLSISRPVLLVIDDLQWADLDTIRMIENVFTANEPGRVAIVATCRDEGVDRAHPIQELQGARRGAEQVSVLRLGRLSEDAVAQILDRGRDRESTAAGTSGVARELHTITGGSPLYLAELIDHLTEEGMLRDAGDEGWVLVDYEELSVPDSVVALMAGRVERLGADVHQVLTAAAVMGASFDLAVLADVLDTTVVATIEAIEIASSARLIREGDDGSCSFADELIRVALLRELRPNRRALLHEAVGRSLEVLRPQDIDLLAAHWSAAIGPIARDKAVMYLRQAGARDMASAAWESSADRHREVLDLLHSEHGEGEAYAEVLYALGLSLRKLGRSSYRPELIRAAGLARQNQNGELLAKCAIAMMRPGAWYPEADVVDQEIVDMCDDALLLLGSDDPQRARVLAALAVNLTFGSEPAERMALVEESQRIAKTSGDLILVGTSLAAELIAFQHPDRFQRRRELAEEVRKIGRATGASDLLFAGSWFLVLDMVALGDVEQAITIVDELTEVVRSSREYWPSFLVSHFGTALAIARCDDDAAELIEQERLEFEDQPVDWFGVSVIQTAAIAVGHGTLADMMLSLVAAADEHESSEWAKKWNYALSRAYVDAGDTDAALAAIAMNPDPEPDYYWIASVYHLGLLGLKTRRRDICEDVIAKLSPYRGRIGLIGLGACLSGQVSTALGQAHLGMGELDLAEEHFRESVAQAESLSFRYFETTARRFLAQTLLERDATCDEAHDLLGQVIEASERHNFGLEQAEAVKMLNALRLSGTA